MAHKKGAGSSRNGRESASKRLGIKKFGGQQVIPGNIIARQRGTKYHPGAYVGMGKDHTLYALVAGKVTFRQHRKGRLFVSISRDKTLLRRERSMAATFLISSTWYIHYTRGWAIYGCSFSSR